MGFLEELIEMGFPENRAKKALAKTNSVGTAVAMDWLFAHSEDPDIDDPLPGDTAAAAASSSTGGSAMEGVDGGGGGDEASTNPEDLQAKSLVCQKCNKKLRTEADVQLHAARTGHTDFAESVDEIKPLTEEEKKQQLALLQERLKEKRKAKEEEEKQEQIAKEKIRRSQGKDTIELKKQREELEMKKALEAKTREKAEEKIAKAKALAAIEQDKAERRARLAAANPANAAAGATAAPTQATSVAAIAAASQPPAAAQNATEARIQIRQPDGPALTNTFPSESTVGDLYRYVKQQRGDRSEILSLSMTYPRKIFTDADHSLTLRAAGLVPSAALVLTTKKA